MSGGGSLCRMVLLLYAEGIEGGLYAERRGPCAAERTPRAAERRPLCQEQALCAGRYSVLRGLEEAPVSGRRLLCREEAILCREVPCAERI